MTDKKIGDKGLSNRKRTSLVTKINLKMIGRVVAGFSGLNILIILIGLFLVFWKVEDKARGILKTIDLYSDSQGEEVYHIEDYMIIKTDEDIKGYKIPKFVENIFPSNLSNEYFRERRSIEVLKGSRNIKFTDRLELVIYNILFSYKGEIHLFKYPLGGDLKVLLYIFLIIFGFEVIFILTNIGKGAKIIRNALKPLSDLSETARSINASVSSTSGNIKNRELENLTGVISNIDANRLDKEIKLDSSQDELRDLAYAINSMLNRINSSYKSQVQFVSDASHELRTPISIIQGYVNLLDRWGKEDEKTLQESIDAIKDETNSMKELVEQLLFLARGDNESIELQMERFDISMMLEKTLYEMEMIHKDNIFEKDLEGPIWIEADRQLIRQAIRILIDNSIKYSPSNEKIILKVKQEEGFAHIIVQDNGIGIDPADISQIFNRFYRTDKSRARNTGGSGLGLSIAKWIIERHGAHFQVLSRLDIGTRISIIFPTSNK